MSTPESDEPGGPGTGSPGSGGPFPALERARLAVVQAAIDHASQWNGCAQKCACVVCKAVWKLLEEEKRT